MGEKTLVINLNASHVSAKIPSSIAYLAVSVLFFYTHTFRCGLSVLLEVLRCSANTSAQLSSVLTCSSGVWMMARCPPFRLQYFWLSDQLLPNTEMK